MKLKIINFHSFTYHLWPPACVDTEFALTWRTPTPVAGPGRAGTTTTALASKIIGAHWLDRRRGQPRSEAHTSMAMGMGVHVTIVHFSYQLLSTHFNWMEDSNYVLDPNCLYFFGWFMFQINHIEKCFTTAFWWSVCQIRNCAFGVICADTHLGWSVLVRLEQKLLADRLFSVIF